jgi:hypothetical protein
MSIFDFSVLDSLKIISEEPAATGFEHLILVPNTLIGTVDEIYERNLEIPWTTSHGFLVLFEDMEGKAEIFTSFLSTVLVNTNLWGGAGLYSEFKTKLRNFLDSKSDKWTREALKTAFDAQQMIVDDSRSSLLSIVGLTFSEKPSTPPLGLRK